MKIKIIRDIGPVGCINNPSFGEYEVEKEVTKEELLDMLNHPQNFIKIVLVQ